jgi:hypothetical protein
MPSNEKQVGGNHYQSAIQTWDYILSHDLGFLEGNVIKYITRHRKKNGMQDLEKALHYLNKLIEVENDRLQHPHDRTEQIAKDVPEAMPQERPIGLRNVLENSGRSQVAHEFSTGYRPTCLSDVI